MDLHNILFEELERLNDEDLTGDDLAAEIKRAKAIEGVADQVIANTSNMLTAMRFQAQTGGRVPVALMGGGNEE
jgi:hypothetical protein